MSKKTLHQQILAFRNSKEILDKRCFYFFDWFCQEKSLEKKAMSLMPKVIKFVEAMEIDTREHYVIFKNNCPMNGSLYDDFRICNINDGNVIYTVIPSCGHNSTKGKAEVWCMFNDFREPMYREPSWKSLVQTMSK